MILVEVNHTPLRSRKYTPVGEAHAARGEAPFERNIPKAPGLYRIKPLPPHINPRNPQTRTPATKTPGTPPPHSPDAVERSAPSRPLAPGMAGCKKDVRTWSTTGTNITIGFSQSPVMMTGTAGSRSSYRPLSSRRPRTTRRQRQLSNCTKR